MKTRRRVSLLAFAVSLHFITCAPALAQRASDGPGRPADDSLEVAVESASGKERRPKHHGGVVDRVGLRPGQTVRLKLKFKGKATGEIVTVSPLDGGTIDGQEGLATSAEGNVQFSYQAGSAPGRYRVALHLGSEEYEFEFYVLDLHNAENNPPNVRVVD